MPLAPILAASRVAIAGGPGAGKTTLADRITDRPVIRTDDYMGVPWESVPHALMDAAREAGPRFAIEGVQVARALRKGLAVDLVVWLPGSHKPLNNRQTGMAKAVRTVMVEWLASSNTPVLAECECRGQQGCERCNGKGAVLVTQGRRAA